MPPDLEARAFGARVSASGAKKYLPKHKRTPLNRIHPTGLKPDALYRLHARQDTLNGTLKVCDNYNLKNLPRYSKITVAPVRLNSEAVFIRVNAITFPGPCLGLFIAITVAIDIGQPPAAGRGNRGLWKGEVLFFSPIK